MASTENLKSDPPVIIFSQKPAVLISFDGEPETRPIKDSPYEQVVNTAVLIIKDKSSGNFYLSNGQTWYIATNPKGPWSAAKCDADPADRASWESELRESPGQAWASWQAVALHSG